MNRFASLTVSDCRLAWTTEVDVIIYQQQTPDSSITMAISPPFRSLLDRFGATGSMICAVHCALTPLLLAAIPSLGLSAWLGDGSARCGMVRG